MYNSVPMEAGFFGASLVAGIIAAFIYDLLRVSRRILGSGDGLVNLEDILFLVAAAVIIFGAAYLKNSGEVRWQGFIGFGAGAGLYALVVKNRFLNVSTAIIKWMIKVAEKIVKIVLFPIRLIFKIFKRPVNVVMWYTGQSVRRAKSVVRRGGDRLSLRLKNVGFMLRKK